MRVSAAGVNPVDWKIREGRMKEMRTFTFPITLGSELAGTVAALGGGVSDLAPGDRVHGSTGALGAFAEFAVIARNAVAKIPGELDFGEAAALPVGVLTATAACKAGAVGRDTSVLIHAASGGAGTIAIQLARALGPKSPRWVRQATSSDSATLVPTTPSIEPSRTRPKSAISMSC